MTTRQDLPEEAGAAAGHLLSMVAQIGDLSRQYQRTRRDGDHQGWGKLRVREELGDVLWHLTAFAYDLGLDMEDVAVANLTKTADRWIPSADWHIFDEDFPAEERLPASIAYKFRTYRKPDGVFATEIYRDGVQVGATLTDASRNTDSYRLHDVFHLSYACLLGWSPVTRALLGCKRRSDPAVDENEDGGRAIAIEEGLAASIFAYAATRDYLSGAAHVDGDVLASIATSTAQLEVGVRTAADWERAVLEGFRVWKQLDDHGGNGIVLADLHARSMGFEPITDATGGTDPSGSGLG
ncbi:MazG nucleotide pyrophosphohydrolase domain-containing protein [Amycolatopsis sp. NPDC003865]